MTENRPKDQIFLLGYETFFNKYVIMIKMAELFCHLVGILKNLSM